MTEDDTYTVTYQDTGPDEHLVTLGSEALTDIRIDYTDLPEDRRRGTAVKLLCASTLYCFAYTFRSALLARGATVKALTGQATAVKEKDDMFRAKVTRIRITLTVDIDDQDLPILAKCKSIMKQGCLVTHSVREAIDIEYDIRRKPDQT